MFREPLRCAGALILDDAGRIFIQRRAPTRSLFPGCWDIVGGHLEQDETFEQALQREIREETGWRLSHVLAELTEIQYDDEAGVTRLERDYLVRVEGDLLAPRLAPGEHTEWRWIERSEIGLVNEHRGIGDRLAEQIITDGFAAAAQMGIL